MDPTDTVQVFCSSGKGLTKAMVSVDWNDDYNTKYHSSLHPLIEEVWMKKSQNSIRLFNASKFRFHSIDVNKTVDGVSDVKFYLGTTSYKEFIGTNCAPFAEKLVKDGINDYSDPSAYLANPVGVGGILETVDGDLIFMRRSSTCAEMPLLVDRPGGHPEPDEVASGIDEKGDGNSRVIDEIFDSVLKEIRDEINIPIDKLSSPLLLGISYNPETWKRPSLEFYVKCHLSTKEVQALYAEQTQAESEESTLLVVVPVSKVLDADTFKMCDFYNDLTHAAKGAVYCLQIFLSKHLISE